jgi:hypothetical protein
MNTINRTAVIISPKQPYIDWANSFEDSGPMLEPFEIQPTVFLIPDKYDEYNFDKYLKKKHAVIFEEELASWMTDPDVWPKSRSYKKFNEWFKVSISDMVIDLGADPITVEEY